MSLIPLFEVLVTVFTAYFFCSVNFIGTFVKST